jgi:hypothetical protein
MSESNSVHEIASAAILAEWEGPAIHEPGVLFEDKTADHALAEANASELAAWIAVTALSGPDDHEAHKAIRAKVVGVLSAWQQRYGQTKIAEVKQQLLQHLHQYRNHRKLTDEELHKRVELLFDEIQPIG